MLRSGTVVRTMSVSDHNIDIRIVLSTAILNLTIIHENMISFAIFAKK